MSTRSLYPDTDEANAFLREILDSFPGIWFVTVPGGGVILESSKNYCEQARGTWFMLRTTTTESGLVVNWLVRPQFELIGGSHN